MRNLHLIILQEFGIEARRLLREWERLRLRSSDYKNHRIFSLRCIHKELIPVSIKLKSTLDTPKARQIIRKAEKDLLQARIKAINNILVQVEREIQDCRAKLASIISQERLEQCQHFINKVSELRFNKVKQRQINKLNHLVSKKEGNITNITLNRQVQSPPNSRNPTPATALLPPGEGDISPQATVHLPREGNSSFNNQASNNNNTKSNSVNSNTVSNQTNSQGPSHNQTPAIAHLPPGKEAILSRELYSFPRKLPALPLNPGPLPQGKKTILTKPILLLQPIILNPIGHPSQGTVVTPQGKQAGLQASPPGINPLNLPLRPVQPPGKVPPPPHPPVGPAKVLLLKNLALSGSLTCPTNL